MLPLAGFPPSPQLFGESWLVMHGIEHDPDQGPTVTGAAPNSRPWREELEAVIKRKYLRGCMTRAVQCYEHTKLKSKRVATLSYCLDRSCALESSKHCIWY